MHNFDSIVESSITLARSEAHKNKITEIFPELLLLGLLKNPKSYSSTALNKYLNEIKSKINELPKAKNPIEIEAIRPSTKLTEWLTYASSHSIQNGKEEISEADLLRYMPQIFPNLKIDYKDLNPENLEEKMEAPSFLTNLNELAEKGKLDPVIGRSKEIRAVMEILGRRSKNNPVLVGPAGVGKTAIIEGLAMSIVNGNVTDILQDKIVYALDLGSLMAGTKYRGEFEERLQSLLKFMKAQNGNAFLFIDEIHQLVGAGKTDGAMDAANLLKPALARGELHCIGATTTDEYQKYILNDSALERRFRPVVVNEPTNEDAVEILMGIKEKMEIHHGIKISDEAIYNAVFLSAKYITDKNLPDKAIDLIDEASSALKLSTESMPAELVELEAEIRTKKIFAKSKENNSELEKEINHLEQKFLIAKKEWDKNVYLLKQVTENKHQLEKLKFELEQAQRIQNYEKASEIKYKLIPEIEEKIKNSPVGNILTVLDIAQIISRQKGIPVEKILKSKQEKILELNNFLKKRVFGQEAALSEISECLITSYAGLSNPNRPLGSFLLLGPSGVGKTETAKTLSEFLFDSENNMIRIDLSEYSEKHSVAKLIGAPAGYVGYEEGGILTNLIRNKPYSVILFDEIEKAHPDFSDILLQILDDGRLTDNKGRTVDFKNTIIIMTSNSKNIELDFKPEVLGRLDARLNYSKLDEKIMKNLIEKELFLLNERLSSKKLKISLDDECFLELANRGYDERFGARPLNAVFSKFIIRPLSKKILAGNLNIEGDILLKWNDLN